VIQYRSAADAAAEAKMVRTTFSGTIAFVEGSTDERLIEKFVDAEECYLLVAFGKENAAGAVDILISDGTKGILAIVDADHSNVTGENAASENLLVTEAYDLEMLVIQSDAFERVLSEYGSGGKIAAFLKTNQHSSLRELLVDRCIPLGMLRLMSRNTNPPLNLKFEGLKLKGIVDGATLNINTRRLVASVVNNTAKPGLDPVQIEKDLEEALTKATPDRYQLCCGHDVAEVLGIGLRKALGSRVEAIACGEHIESALRLAYELRDFAKTRLYSLIRDWELRNSPYRVLVRT
jgi:hypothetical protein